MTDDAEVRAHVFKLLGYVFAQRFERATAFRAVFLAGSMHTLFAFEVIGQRFAVDQNKFVTVCEANLSTRGQGDLIDNEEPHNINGVGHAN